MGANASAAALKLAKTAESSPAGSAPSRAAMCKLHAIKDGAIVKRVFTEAPGLPRKCVEAMAFDLASALAAAQLLDRFAMEPELCLHLIRNAVVAETLLRRASASGFAGGDPRVGLLAMETLYLVACSGDEARSAVCEMPGLVDAVACAVEMGVAGGFGHITASLGSTMCMHFLSLMSVLPDVRAALCSRGRLLTALATAVDRAAPDESRYAALCALANIACTPAASTALSSVHMLVDTVVYAFLHDKSADTRYAALMVLGNLALDDKVGPQLFARLGVVEAAVNLAGRASTPQIQVSALMLLCNLGRAGVLLHKLLNVPLLLTTVVRLAKPGGGAAGVSNAALSVLVNLASAADNHTALLNAPGLLDMLTKAMRSSPSVYVLLVLCMLADALNEDKVRATPAIAEPFVYALQVLAAAVEQEPTALAEKLTSFACLVPSLMRSASSGVTDDVKASAFAVFAAVVGHPVVALTIVNTPGFVDLLVDTLTARGAAVDSVAAEALRTVAKLVLVSPEVGQALAQSQRLVGALVRPCQPLATASLPPPEADRAKATAEYAIGALTLYSDDRSHMFAVPGLLETLVRVTNDKTAVEDGESDAGSSVTTADDVTAGAVQRMEQGQQRREMLDEAIDDSFEHPAFQAIGNMANEASLQLAMAQIPGMLPMLLRACTCGQWNVRRNGVWIAHNLSETAGAVVGTPDMIEALTHALSDAHELTRMFACLTLAKIVGGDASRADMVPTQAAVVRMAIEVTARDFFEDHNQDWRLVEIVQPIRGLCMRAENCALFMTMGLPGLLTRALAMAVEQDDARSAEFALSAMQLVLAADSSALAEQAEAVRRLLDTVAAKEGAAWAVGQEAARAVVASSL